ncbi:MAG: GAF domain-containing protein [Nitrospina sp.]|nr:MAG: GAF domain-containing protein [Nitrospina sp.]
MDASLKEQTYKRVTREILSVIEGEDNLTARMASLVCLLHHAFDYYFWTGFYVPDPNKDAELVVGPYQGTLGCLRIPFGTGVCGVAAEKGETQIVADIHSFPGHIACDFNSKSEIVVPVYDRDKNLIGVFDVDATSLGAFDEIDKSHLETLLATVFSE